MKVKSIKEIYEIADKGDLCDINLAGWVRTARLSKTIGFIELYDGTIQRTIDSSYITKFLFNNNIIINYCLLGKNLL